MTCKVDFTGKQKLDVKKYIKSMRNEEENGNLFQFSKDKEVCSVSKRDECTVPQLPLSN
jgi:hypothetical protein